MCFGHVGTGRRVDYVLYVLACTAGIYTHLTMAFVVGGHVVVLVAERASRWRLPVQEPLAPLLAAWAGVAALAAGLYAPFLSGLVANVQADAPRQAATVATPTWAVLEGLRSLLSGAGVPGAVGAGFLALVGAFSMTRRNPTVVALLVAPALLTATTIVGLNQPLRPRFFFFLGGAAALFVGRGLGATSDALMPARRTAAVAVGTMLLIALSATALSRNYRLPKQDFDGAVAFLAMAEAQGAQIASAGPACLPWSAYYGKVSWTCLKNIDDWRHVSATDRRMLVAYTLPDYLDATLREALHATCPAIRVFEGTLGGGDIIVCEPAPATIVR